MIPTRIDFIISIVKLVIYFGYITCNNNDFLCKNHLYKQKSIINIYTLMSATYTLTITITKDFVQNDNETLRDIIGAEFMKYYDGCGYDNSIHAKDFFFYEIPENLLHLITTRLKRDNMTYIINPTMEQYTR